MEPATEALYQHFQTDPRFQTVHYREPFNFGKACNLGARHANGEFLLFLNNDTEILHADWLDRMMQWFELPATGVVGAKLLYPDGSIQHAGVIVGMGGLAAHVFNRLEEHTSTIFGSDDWFRNYAAVTGACMLVRKDLFDQAGGFDEKFQLNWSDVDPCLKIRKAGHRIVYTPLARLIHHEAASHQKRIPRSDFVRAGEKWLAAINAGDRYFNPNLSYGHAIPHLLLDRSHTSRMMYRDLMARLPQKEIIRIPDDLK
jgi:GT2 family glycosyltransferase